MSAQNSTSKKSGSTKTKDRNSPSATLQGISVVGYKSIGERQHIDIRPLTLLAGANSGGKSSLIQPMLLLKQTLDAPYDPGSLLLDGQNVRLTSSDQLLTRSFDTGLVDRFAVWFDFGVFTIELAFHKAAHGLEVQHTIIKRPQEKDIVLNMNLNQEDMKALLGGINLRVLDIVQLIQKSVVGFATRRNRCFVTFDTLIDGSIVSFSSDEVNILISFLMQVIHLPGLRGNPERTYKTTAVGDMFPGTFENYVASIIHHWNSNNDPRLAELGKHLEILGLTWKITAKSLDDTQVELRVGRLPHSQKSSAQDLVSIADVGFGVSQTLPLLVALLTAKSGQVVYLEQPEIHLHPRAQIALAKILAEAAQRGVIVIAETHSALLLQGVQTLVAKDELSPNLVKLHWVQRDEQGMTRVNSADLDNAGAFGDWPVDFMDVGLEADNEYLSAAEAKLFGQAQ